MFSPSAPSTLASSAQDFDFLFGRWQVANRRLVRRLAGSTEWETFPAINIARPLLGGLGNLDEFRAEDWRPGFIGSTLRLFNPTTRQWSIYWVDNQRGVLEPPVIGEWRGDTGIFEGPDLCDGRPVVSRFTWTRLGADRACWEQAFSPDEGRTWETNWIMEFTRCGE